MAVIMTMVTTLATRTTVKMTREEKKRINEEQDDLVCRFGEGEGLVMRKSELRRRRRRQR